ncbi:MAG TPA: hypothetical protein PKD90_17510, partial [Phnomibacter sp.]|nr:hypothetical protein [Phnomibacter sp.]
MVIAFLPAVTQPVIKSNWNAKWIGQPFADAPNSFIRFSKNWELNNVPERVLAHIAVDSKYWLWINGKLVVFEGQLKRGPTPNDTYFDELDIAPFLKVGDNKIALLVWYWGKDGFCHKSSGKAGLLFEAAAGDSQLLSNQTWKISPHPAFLQQSAPPYPNYRLPEFNIRYDARLADGEFYKEAFSSQNWANATELGKAGAMPWGNLWQRPIPMWYNTGLVAYESIVERSADAGGTSIVEAVLPKNLAITPYLEVDAPAGLLI